MTPRLTEKSSSVVSTTLPRVQPNLSKERAYQDLQALLESLRGPLGEPDIIQVFHRHSPRLQIVEQSPSTRWIRWVSAEDEVARQCTEDRSSTTDRRCSCLWQKLLSFLLRPFQ